MLSPSLLTDDQLNAVDRLYGYDENFVVAKMGAGKTIITLTAIKELLEDDVLDRVLIFAPLKVVKTVWRQEAENWEHTKDMNIRVCVGTPLQRQKIIEHSQQQKCVMVLNFDLMAWFFETYGAEHGFDGLVIDELSKMKDGGKNFKKMRRHLKTFKWRTGLTGTPVAENFEGLFYQTYCLDVGKRFGGNKTKYLEKYFTPDYNGYNWEIRPGAAGDIMRLLAGLVYTVPDYRDSLPSLVKLQITGPLPDDVMEQYKWLENHHTIELGGLDQIADNAAVLSGKLQQFASGAIYLNDEFNERVGVHRLHDVKLAACHKQVSKLLSQGENVIICYWYQHELERLREVFPNARELSEPGAQDAWNRGEVPVLLLQPQSASHGIQLQHGGRCMVFYSPVWSNDIVEQTIARIWRKGQKRDCWVWELVAENTIDELIIDRVNGKKEWDKIFEAGVKG